MSLVLGSSLSALFFGGAAVAAAAAGSIGTRIVVEPEILSIFSDLGYPWLMGESYDEIIMNQSLSAANTDKRPWGLYITQELLRSTPSPEATLRLASELSALGLKIGEDFTIATALATAHDMVFLVNKHARDVASEFGLTSASPMQAIVDAFKRELITSKELVSLSNNLYKGGFR